MKFPKKLKYVTIFKIFSVFKFLSSNFNLLTSCYKFLYGCVKVLYLNKPKLMLMFNEIWSAFNNFYISMVSLEYKTSFEKVLFFQIYNSKIYLRFINCIQFIKNFKRFINNYTICCIGLILKFKENR